MCDWTEKGLPIADEMYDYLYDQMKWEYRRLKCEYEVGDFEEFLVVCGESDYALSLLPKDEEYYIAEAVKVWDDVIFELDRNDMLDDIEPKEMTKKKITEKMLHMVCVDVIRDYVADINNEYIRQRQNLKLKKY